MNTSRLRNHFIILSLFVFILFSTLSVFAGPGKTTYQAKIVKPDGYPLEVSSVNFKFTILDPAGSCILYAETYSSVNMSGTGGLISFALGSGVKTYPASATTFEQVFSNITPSLSCDTGGPPSYSPLVSDSRKIVMQFHDGSGWQTLPAMSINAVPYAMYANDATKLNGLTSSDFVQVSTVPTCATSEALRYTGAGFTCVAVGNSVTSSTVVTALGYTPADGASLTTVTSNISSVSSTVFSVSSTVTSLQNSVAASFAAITSSQWTTSGTNIFYNTGNIGIGTTTPVTKLDVSGGVRIGAESTTCAPALAGTLRYNASNVEYCNGTSWQAFGVSGSGITNFNGSTSGTQSFTTGTGGTAPNINTLNGVHTLNIPLASTGSVTAGLISNTDYTTFTNKITSSAASIAQVLGYVPADNAVSGTYAQKANNLSDLTNVATARTNLGLGTFATASSIDLGSASATGTLAIARLPSFSGDATIAAASNTIILSNSGVTAGTYTKVTVDSKGRVTSSAALASSDVTAALGYTPANSATTVGSQWATSGANIYYNTGNVGIGTTTPSAKLQVSGGILAKSDIVNHDDSDFRSALSLTHSGTGTGYGNGSTVVQVFDNMEVVNFENGYLMFKTQDIDRLRITAGGDVGIGIAAPTARLHLTSGTTSVAPLRLTSSPLLSTAVSGAIEYDGTNLYYTDGTNTRRAVATTNGSTLNNVAVVSSTAGITLWPAAGNSVSVSSTVASTNSSTGALVVKGGLGVAGDIYTSGTIVTSSNIQGASITATSGISANVIQGNTNLLLNPNSGNVGVGVTAFGANGLLQVNGDIGLQGNRVIRPASNADSDSLKYIGNQVVLGSAQSNAYSYSGGALIAARSNSNGVKLIDVGRIDAVTNYGKFLVENSSLGNVSLKLIDANNNVTLFSDSLNGNVGIGTSAPAAKFEVSNSVSAVIRVLAGTGNGVDDDNLLRLMPQDGSGEGGHVEWKGSGSYQDWTIDTVAGNLRIFEPGQSRNAVKTRGGISFVVNTSATSTPNTIEALKISAAGNVGIGGATNPIVPLHVVGKSWIDNNSGDSVTRALGQTISVAPVANYSPGVDPADSLRGLSIISKGATRPSVLGLRNVDYANRWWDFILDPNTSGKLYLQYTGTSGTGNTMTFDGDNVGIGTNAPVATLDITSSLGAMNLTRSIASTAGPDIYLQKDRVASAVAVGDSLGHLNFRGYTGASYTRGARISSMVTSAPAAGQIGADLRFYTNNSGADATERLRIDQIGHVGIGTTTPTYGDVNLTTNSWGLLTVAATPTTAAGAAALTLANQKATPAAGDRVGAVHFVNTNNGSQLYSGFINVSLTGSGGADGFGGEMSFFTKADNSTSSLQRMIITNSGNVGIGTATPDRTLEVSGTVESRDTNLGGGTDGAIRIKGNATTGFYGGSYGTIQFVNQVGNAQWATIIGNSAGNLLLQSVGGNVGIGTSAPSYKLDVNGTIRGFGITDSSDIRLKKDIQPLDLSLEKILKIDGVSYYWKDPSMPKKQIGFIAQQLEKIYPELVETDKEGMKSVNYSHLVAPIVDAIKSLYQRIQGLEKGQELQNRQMASMAESSAADKKEIEKLKTENAELKARLSKIEKALNLK